MITQDLQFLRQVSDPVTIGEVDDIVHKLEKELNKCNNGVGLSAVQIGIPKRVSVIKHRDSFIHLINAKVIEEEEPFVFVGEGCLSMPGVFVDTQRYKQVTISTDVIRDDKFEEEEWLFYWDGTELTPIAIQHEIDYFDGILIQDREIIVAPAILSSKTGRNDPCPCGKKKPDGKPLKYKKCCGKVSH